MGDLGGERSGSLSTVTVGESVVRGQGLEMFGMGAGGKPEGSGHGFAIGSLSWCGGSTLSYASGDVHAALWCKYMLYRDKFFEELSVPYGYPA